MTLRNRIKAYLACKRLNRLVERELAKLEARNFDKRSRASKLGWARRKARKEARA